MPRLSRRLRAPLLVAGALSLLVPAVATASPSVPTSTDVATASPLRGAAATGTPGQATTYLVGAGIYDITGAVAETGAFGYASNQEMTGLHQRLYSHAYIVGDRASGKRVVFVSADLAAIFPAVKIAVGKELKARYGDVYTDDNVMLTATHTHVGTSGLATETLYQIAGADGKGYKYSSQNVKAVVGGIVQSIVRAHENLEPGTIELARGELTGATKNRSQKAYLANKDLRAGEPDVDTTMTQLKLKDASGKPLGLVNWFATHPTSFNIHWTQISADNKGYAEYQFEQRMKSRPTDPKPFVAAFGNSDMGDVVAVDGTSVAAPGYVGDPDDFVNAERAGKRQLDKAVELWDGPSAPLSGPVDYRARWANFKDYTVGAEYTHGAAQKLCKPARGFSFAAGGENGPSGIPGIYEGMTKGTFSLSDKVNKVDQSALGTLVRSVFGMIGMFFQDPCQAEKPVLLPTGAWGWAPTTLPFQVVRVGNLAIVAVPGEATTTSGRRIRATVQERLRGSGVDTVVLAGPANTYSGYVTTREEYATQNYEGASTEFGPNQLGAFQQEYARLATAMADGSAVTDDLQPEDLTGRHFPERPGVLFDDKPGNQQFGQVLVQPKATYTPGERVRATFRAGHPKNNLRTMGTFLEVQRQVGDHWETYLTDRDWDTSYLWQREGVSFSRATVEWRTRPETPAGTYRIVQTGDWKNGWNGTITPYTGTSDSFRVG